MKNKTTLIGILIISLFVIGVNNKINPLVVGMAPPEKVQIFGLIYPDKISEGKILEIEVYFVYETPDFITYCLYGDDVQLWYTWGVENATVTIFPKGKIETPILESSRPSKISIFCNTSALGLEEIYEDVIFEFVIRYEIGYIDALGNTYFSESVMTDFYELTISDVKKIGMSITYFVIPLSVLSIVLLIRKGNKKIGELNEK